MLVIFIWADAQCAITLVRLKVFLDFVEECRKYDIKVPIVPGIMCSSTATNSQSNPPLLECPVVPLGPLVPNCAWNPGLNGLGGLKRMTELCKTRLPEGLLERAEKANTSDEAFKDLGELGNEQERHGYMMCIYIYIYIHTKYVMLFGLVWTWGCPQTHWFIIIFPII